MGGGEEIENGEGLLMIFSSQSKSTVLWDTLIIYLCRDNII